MTDEPQETIQQLTATGEGRTVNLNIMSAGKETTVAVSW